MDTLVGTSIGGYTLVRLLGAGGMGSVYLANDPTVGQQVAVKIIRADVDAYTDSASAKLALERFRQEARAVARLDHLHILPLYRYGEEPTRGNQRAYMIMQYRPEGSLWDWLRRRADYTSGNIQPSQVELNTGLPTNWPLNVEEVAEYLQQASSALQYAHDRGIVHRDIKPANFLLRVDMHDKTVHLLLSDFGLAKVFTASSATNTALGTPTYMAPEQFEGAARPASDQYALAVMVYFMLAGRPPFEGDPMQLMRQHLSADVPSLTTFNPRVPPYMNGVFARALAKQPEQRFPSVSAFADAFVKVAQGLPISSLAISRQHAPDPTRGFVPAPDQAPVVPGLLGLPSNDQAARRTPGSLVLPGAANPAPGMHNTPSSSPTVRQSQTPPNAASPAPTVYAAQQGMYPPTSPMPGNTCNAQEPFAQPVDGYSQPSQQQGEQRVSRRGALGWVLGTTAAVAAISGGAYFYLNNQNSLAGTSSQILRTLTGHTNAVTSLSWLFDGSQLASGSLDKTVRLWSPQSNSASRVIHSASAVDSLAWNPDGTRLALGGADHDVMLWRPAGPAGRPETGWGAAISALAWDSHFLFIGTDGNGLHALNSTTNKHFGRPNASVRVNGISVAPDDTLLAVALETGHVYFADLANNWAPVATIRPNIVYGAARAVAWSLDGVYVAVGYEKNAVVIYNTGTKQWQYTIPHNGPVNSVAWQPGANVPTLASGSDDMTVKISKPTVSKVATAYTGHKDAVLSVAWSSTGILASASKDQAVILWKAPA